jgi:alpha-tubulin suppressor-like RCC1 family protein
MDMKIVLVALALVISGIALAEGTAPEVKKIPFFAGKAICGGTHTLIIEKDGTLWAAGDNHAGELGLGIKSDFVISSRR